MIKKNQLAKAIAMVIAGSAMSVAGMSSASASATTMYNMYRGNYLGVDGSGIAQYASSSTTPCAPCNNPYSTPTGADNGSGNMTDGWVWDANPDNVNSNYNHTAASADPSRPGWVGISGSSTVTTVTPFGYSAGTSLNWAVDINGGGIAEISNADSIARYGQSADIDTAKGAWSDVSSSGAAGWKHDLDWGLFRSNVTGLVTLSATGVNLTGTNFGFTIFKGMSSQNGAYNHHGGWNGGGNNAGGAPTNSNIPGGSGFTLANMVAWSTGDNPATTSVNESANLNTISFYATANQVYTVAIGGYRNGAWYDTSDGYKLTISQVPVPGAVWMMGSGLLGLIGVCRKRSAA